MNLIYKILPASLWHAAQENGQFEGSAVDLADGFIHFSTRDQVEETAAKWFAGQTELMLIGVDPSKVGDGLRYEPSRGGALFPHLYAPLALVAVVSARPVPLRPDGTHDFTGLLA
jgi:uncharacterized protein (DUF952 family)